MDAYKKVEQETLSGSEVEAAVLIKAANKLQDCQEQWDAEECELKLDESLKFNQLVWDQMKTVYDPEIPINVVELGLIYGCGISKLPNGKRYVYVEMTLTAPGCGMGEILVQDVREKIGMIPTVGKVDVERRAPIDVRGAVHTDRCTDIERMLKVPERRRRRDPALRCRRRVLAPGHPEVQVVHHDDGDPDIPPGCRNEMRSSDPGSPVAHDHHDLEVGIREFDAGCIRR